MSEWNAKAAAEDAADEVSRLRDELASLKDDIARLVKNMRSGASELGDEAHDLYERLSKEGERSARAVIREVEERPLTALLVAFAVGFISGRFLPR